MKKETDVIDVTYTEVVDVVDIGESKEDIQDISKTTGSEENRKFLKIIGVILGIIVLFVLNLYKVSINLDTDTMWHIKTGEWIVKNKAFPTEDVFSWVEGLEWKAHEVGFDIILYEIYNKLGVVGVKLLGNILTLTGISIVTLYNYKRQRYNWGYLIFAICMYMCFSIISVSRPAEATIILLLINIWVYTDRGKPLSFWITYPITTFLCSWLHGGYIVSLLLQMVVLLIADIILLLHSKRQGNEDDQKHYKNIIRNKIIVIIVGTLTSLLNPLGYKIYTYSLNQPDILYESIAEWQPWSSSSIIASFLLGLVLISLSFTKLKDFDREALQNGLLLAFWFISLLTYTRCENQLVPIYCMVGYSGVEDFFKAIKDNLLPKLKENNKLPKIIKGITKGIGITGLSLGMLAILKLYYIPMLNIVQEDEESACYKFSKGAIEYLKENNITEGVFNTYNTGGYLIFEDYPTFLDPRADPFVIETSTKDVFRDVDNINNVLDREQAWLDLAQKYDIEYFVFMPEVGSKSDVYLFLNSDKFELVYEDNSEYINYESILKQTDQNKDNLTIGDSGYFKKGYVFKLKQDNIQQE